MRSIFFPTGISLNFQAIFLFFIVCWLALATKLTDSTIAVFLFITAGWLVSLCVHEYGHALLAYLAGDHSVEQKGYLTLDPLAYTHPVLSILYPMVFLALGGIGLPGGAVYVDTRYFRSRLADSLVSAAGPAGTAVCFIVLWLTILLFMPVHGAEQPYWAAVSFLAHLQLFALYFNLLPIPGFDGFGILKPYLPARIAQPLLHASEIIATVLLIMMFTFDGVWAFIIGPVFAVSEFLGLDPYAVYTGYDLYSFWD